MPLEALHDNLPCSATLLAQLYFTLAASETTLDAYSALCEAWYRKYCALSALKRDGEANQASVLVGGHGAVWLPATKDAYVPAVEDRGGSFPLDRR